MGFISIIEITLVTGLLGLSLTLAVNEFSNYDNTKEHKFLQAHRKSRIFYNGVFVLWWGVETGTPSYMFSEVIFFSILGAICLPGVDSLIGVVGKHYEQSKDTLGKKADTMEQYYENSDKFDDV